MKYSKEDIEKYSLREIKCPKCGNLGTLLYRKEHHSMFWVVRHHWQQFGSRYAEDKFCHLGHNLPLQIRDMLDGKSTKSLFDF
jgi:hypothetical protein